MNETLLGRLDTIFAIDPGAVAIEQEGKAYTYGQIRQFVHELDDLLLESGLGTGTPMGILLRNHPAGLVAALATIWTQRCLVTVNPMLPAQLLRTDILGLGVPVLIAEQTDWQNPRFLDAARASGALGIQVIEDASGFHVIKILEHGAIEHPRPVASGIAVEMLTSGTTGVPKRIKLQLEGLSRSFSAGSKYESGGRAEIALHKSPSLLWMPLVHIGGLWNALYQLYNGRRILLFERFNIDRWHAAIKSYRLRFATLPPSLVGEVLARNYPTQDFSSLLAIRCGAAPLDHDLAERFEVRYGVPVLEAYGATEFAGGVAGWTIADHRAFSKTKRKSVGRANPGVELRVIDSDSYKPLAANAEGLLEVRSGQNGSGKKWIRTTDIAKIDEDGFLYILGRADNAINRGGFKIRPEDVEAAIRSHPAIAEVCVVGIQDQRVGVVPVAAYEVKPGMENPPPEQIREFLAERLKAYEIPARFMAVAELPRTLSLKISQLAVRELFAACATT